MSQQLKDILLENINNFDVIDNIGNFLKTYNQPSSSFDHDVLNELQLYLMHKYHNHQKISSLFNDPKICKQLNSIPCGLSLEEFKSQIKSLTIISNGQTIPLEKRIEKTFNRNITGDIFGVNSWLRIYVDKLKGVPVDKHTHRIYLAVDNSCLHKFAILLIKQCELYHINYQFKINNNDGQNYYDNVVIYTNESDLIRYINCIRNILNNYQDIKVNNQCQIAYQFDQNIAVAPYIDTNTESYSKIIANAIIYFRDEAKSREEFISNVENILNKTLNSTKILCEKIKNNFENCDSTLENEKPKRI